MLYMLSRAEHPVLLFPTAWMPRLPFVHFPCADFAVQDMVKSVVIVDVLLLGYQRLHGFREVGRYYLHEQCLKSFIVQTKVRVLLQF